MIGNAKGIPRL